MDAKWLVVLGPLPWALLVLLLVWNGWSWYWTKPDRELLDALRRLSETQRQLLDYHAREKPP